MYGIVMTYGIRCDYQLCKNMMFEEINGSTGGLVFVDFGQRCDLIFDTNTANYEVPGRRWVDIHLMRMPSTGYRFDVEPSSLVY